MEDERLEALLADLEQQAEAAYDAERDAEVADRSQAEYARVSLASRLMASHGSPVSLTVTGVETLSGRLDRVGAGCCRLETARGLWVVRLAAVGTVRGVSARSVPEEAWSPLARLGLPSALRALVGAEAVLHLLDGTRVEERVRRVGSDFVEVGEGQDTVLVAFAALAAVRVGRPD